MKTLHFSQDQEQTLNTLGVAAMYVFGSRALGTARPKSDYDIAIIMQHSKDIVPYVAAPLYNALYDMVHDAINERDIPGIDLVFLQRVPLYYTMNVLKSGVLLYDGDPKARAAFEEHARLMYMDFEPYRAELEYAALAMI